MRSPRDGECPQLGEAPCHVATAGDLFFRGSQFMKEYLDFYLIWATSGQLI